MRDFRGWTDFGSSERLKDLEIDEEFRAHIEHRVDDLVAEGLPATEARQRAILEFGDRERLKAETNAASGEGRRSVAGASLFERTWRGLHLALRRLRRSSGFSVTVVLILALGIGMAAAMFTVLDTVVLQPLPVAEPERVVLPRAFIRGDVKVSVFPEQMADLEQGSQSLSEVAYIARHGAVISSLTDGERTLALRLASVSGNFFTLLGARPALGRFLRPEDEVPNGSPTSSIVLSHAAWVRHFGGDSTVIGRHLGSPLGFGEGTIVGVAPDGLSYPPGVDYWAPVIYQGLDVIGRLAPGATVEQARSEFFTLLRRLSQPPQGAVTPELEFVRGEIETFDRAVLGDVRIQAWVIASAAALLLLIACANVGNLTLLRTTSRASEVAVRRSLGAGRFDILGSMLWEGGLLTAAGGIAGFVSARAFLGGLSRLAPTEFPRIDALGVSAVTVGVAAGITLVALVLASLAPAVGTVDGRLPDSLGHGAPGRRYSGSRRRIHARRGLVTFQMALTVVMVAGAALVARSLERLTNVPLGYEPSQLSFLYVVKPVDLQTEDFSALMGQLYRGAERELRLIPGVEALTPVNFFPFVGTQSFNARWALSGQSDADVSSNPVVPWEVGGSEYFRTFDIPILRGRGILDTDTGDAPPVAVVSRATAQAFWPGEDPIGKQIRLNSELPWVTVVGEAGDIRYRALREPTPTIYQPWQQVLFQGYVAIRTDRPLAAILPELREAVRLADPEAEIALAQTMDSYLDGQLALPRLSAFLLSAFGVTALLLATLGVFGLMASAVRERTHELGIRAALGATPGRLRRMVLIQAARITILGGAVGVAGALVATRFLRSLLFEIPTTDPVSIMGAAGLLLIVSLVAAYVPASWATRTNPSDALRAE